MLIEHIFDGIKLVLNNDRRGFVKVSKIATAVRMAMYDLFNDELKIYRESGLITSRIKPFLKTASVTLTNGEGPLPNDFAKEVNFNTNEGFEGTFLTAEEFTDRIKSVILAPDEIEPIGLIKDSKIIVLPSTFPSLDLDYIRNPADFVYATTISGDGRSEVFNAGGSTDIEFGPDSSGEIIRRALLYLGGGTQNQEAAQIGSAG